MDELTGLVEHLSSRNWRKVVETEQALRAAGQEGMQAVIFGMEHPNARIRRACTAFMDHHGTEICVAPLTERLLTDPVPAVRREAVHALACQRCKSSPLEADITLLLIDIYQNEPSRKVRYESLYALTQRMPDDGIRDLLFSILNEETDEKSRKLAHSALRHHDPGYREKVDEEARSRKHFGGNPVKS